MVRLVYFVPRWRQPQSDINTKLDTLIKNVQTFYADEMERHGFGRKTFAFETDSHGKAVVHRFNGNFRDSHYHQHTSDKVTEEVSRQFDLSKNVYLIVVDISTERIDGACGKGADNWSHVGDWGGRAIIPASGHCLNTDFGFKLIAHELGHAFSVFHDFSDDAYIMSFGRNRSELGHCTAEWLNINRYFNARQTPSNNSETTFRVVSLILYPSYAIRFRFEVSDPDGLQHAQFLTPATSIYEAPGEPKLLGCRELEGERKTVEFVTTELTMLSKSVTLRVVDGVGNFSWRSYPLNTENLFPSPNVVSIPDEALAAAVRRGLGLQQERDITQLDMLNLTGLFADRKEITDLSGLEHARNLKYLYLRRNQIEDIAQLAALTNLAVLYLSYNQISDFTPVAGLTKLVALNLSENPSDDISPVLELTQLQTLYLRGYDIQDLTQFSEFTNLLRLGLERNQISDLTPLAEMTQLKNLWIRDNQVQDLTPLTELSHLEWLDLSHNQINDLTPLRSSTQLRILELSGNQIRNLTPLAKFENLTHLILSDNQISDLKPVKGLTNLEMFVADHNQIQDIIPLTNLKELTVLWLPNNQISALKPLTQLYNLVELGIAHNPIADRTPLLALLNRSSKLGLDVNPWKLFPFVLSEGSELPPMYWTDTATSGFYRLAESKETVENTALHIQNITALAVDVEDDKIYWTEKTGEATGKIQCANLNGTNVQLLKDLTSVPSSIALDTADDKLYITTASGKVQTLSTDGSNFQPNLITNLDAPKHIALDVAGGKLYWTEAGKRIRGANLDGRNIKTLVTSLGTLGDIDIAAGKLYWTEQTDENVGKIKRVNLNSTNVDTLTALNSVPFGIAVDLTGQTLYWTSATGKIQQADLNGENIEDLVIGLGEPTDLVLGKTEVHTSVAAAPISMFPDNTALFPNYPNPFNPETWIPYQLSAPADVTLRIYAASGELVRTLAFGHQSAGIYQSQSRAAYWDGRNELGEPVASGIYFYTLSTDDFTATRKMLILK